MSMVSSGPYNLISGLEIFLLAPILYVLFREKIRKSNFITQKIPELESDAEKIIWGWIISMILILSIGILIVMEQTLILFCLFLGAADIISMRKMNSESSATTDDLDESNTIDEKEEEINDDASSSILENTVSANTNIEGNWTSTNYPIMNKLIADNPSSYNRIAGMVCASLILLISIFMMNLWTDVVNDAHKSYCGGSYVLQSQWDKNYCMDVEEKYEEGDLLFMFRELFYSPIINDDEARMDMPGYETWNNDGINPSQMTFWFIYGVGAIVLLVGYISAERRFYKHNMLINIRNKEKIAVLSKIAIDPNCVIDGRISFPEKIPHSYSNKDDFFSVIAAGIAAIGIIIMSLATIINTSVGLDYDSGEVDTRLTVILWQIIQLITFCAAYYMMCISVLSNHKDEADEGGEINDSAEEEITEEIENNLEDEGEEDVESFEHKGPISFEHVLKALGKELEKSRAESSALRFELDMTKDKVQTLEIELEEKNHETKDIQNLQTNMIKMSNEDSKKEKMGKSLSLMDSVLSGDVLFDSSKVDRQIINDPEAIAKAAINAYREGQQESRE